MTGRAILGLPESGGLTLAQAMTRYERELESMDVESLGILAEIGNIVLNDILGAFSGAFCVPLQFAIPAVHSCPACIVPRHGEPESGVWTMAGLQLGDHKLDAAIVLAFRQGCLNKLMHTGTRCDG
jgi:hypothetical protein